MEKLMKVLLSILAILAVCIAVVLIPIPEKPIWHLDESVLFEYHGVGGITAFTDTIKIFHDGRVEYGDAGNVYTTELPDDKLQELTQFINSKRYTLKRESLLTRWTQLIFLDYRYSSYLVNEDGMTVVVEANRILSEIVIQADKEAMSRTHNLTR